MHHTQASLSVSALAFDDASPKFTKLEKVIRLIQSLCLLQLNLINFNEMRVKIKAAKAEFVN